ncbi:PREDICTED: OCIA domain-containing protein 2-like, partial [Nestor notabilis]|uniref:OCIA domain-containing protein 2-like n=1 Tax=Nestor notabilis TaxID=176057 RepID=UPI000523B0AA
QKERKPSVKRTISADQDQQQGTRKETIPSETTQQESQTSPLKQIGWPVFYCPFSQIHSAGEIAWTREGCKKESFWCRALPLSLGSMLVTQGLVSKGKRKKFVKVLNYEVEALQFLLKCKHCQHTCKECEVKLGSNEKQSSIPSAS